MAQGNAGGMGARLRAPRAIDQGPRAGSTLQHRHFPHRGHGISLHGLPAAPTRIHG